MPVTFAPAEVGDVLRISATGPRVEVVSPSDLRLSVPAPNGYIDLWLAEAGVWTVDGTSITVNAAPAGDPPREQRAPVSELRIIGADRSHPGRLNSGDAFVARQTYRDPDTLAPVDPDTVRIRLWKAGWASATELPATKKAVGIYEAHGSVWEGGEHYVQSECSGAWRAVEVTTLKVSPPFMPS